MQGHLTTSLPIQFSGHETFPLRQLWLRKAYDSVIARAPLAPKSVFSDEDAIVRFGVGKNMVTSIRHWALACDVIEEHEGGYRTTDFANRIFGTDGLDPYSEHPTTAWLIHWKLAGLGTRSTTWVWAFNFIARQSFDREQLHALLKQFALDRKYKVSDATIKRDIECFIRSYVPRVGGDSPEEISEPVLGELGLIQEEGKGVFAFRRGAKHTLSDATFALALLQFWDRSSPTTATLSFDAIAHDHGSPGRVFKLDENSVAERVQALGEVTGGKLLWSDTAGMRQAIRRPGNIDVMSLLDAAYV
ncbi:MAG: DUF4007 family protein [Chloroflexota bacterium]